MEMWWKVWSLGGSFLELNTAIVSLGETGQQNSAAESDVSSERAVGSRGICRRWVDDQKPAPKETVQLCTCDAWISSSCFIWPNLIVKNPSWPHGSGSRTCRWVLFREHSRIPRRNYSSECYDDDDLRALNQIRLRSTKRETTSTIQFIHNFCQSIRFWSKVAACKQPQTLNSRPRAWVHVMVCYYAPPVIHGIWLGTAPGEQP